MGNYRFRLSDMIPNAWFYKLKDMSKSRNQNSICHGSKKKLQQTSSSSSSSSAAAALSSKERQSQLLNQRKSYYFSRDLTAAPGDEHEHGIFHDNVETKTRISDSNYSEPPRKSSKKRRSTRRNRVSNRSSPRVVTSSVTAGCSCRATVESVWTKPDSTPEEYPISPLDSSSENEESLADEFGSKSNCFVAPETFDGMLSWSASSRCRHEKDIIMDIEKEPLNEKFQEPTDKVDGLDTVSELNLPPIITNPSKSSRKTMGTLPAEPTKIRRSSAKLGERNACGSLSVKVVKEDILNTSPKEQKTTPARKFSSNSQGLKLRTNSPRIANIKIQGRKSVSSSSSASSRRSMSESFAVVKSSKDPQRDFRDSMVEMIIENNISASKDLEDLLACYLSLNSDEYHDLIIGVFKQIWFDIVDNHSK